MISPHRMSGIAEPLHRLHMRVRIAGSLRFFLMDQDLLSLLCSAEWHQIVNTASNAGVMAVLGISFVRTQPSRAEDVARESDDEHVGPCLERRSQREFTPPYGGWIDFGVNEKEQHMRTEHRESADDARPQVCRERAFGDVGKPLPEGHEH